MKFLGVVLFALIFLDALYSDFPETSGKYVVIIIIIL